MPNSDLKKFSFDPQGNPVYELYSDQQKPPTAASTTTPQQSIAQRAPEEIGSALGVQPPVGLQQPISDKAVDPNSGASFRAAQGAINFIGGGISKAANAAATPKGQEFLGGLGQALTATAPQSWQYQLGGQVREGAKSQMQNALYGKVLSGEKLTAEDFAGMPSDVVQNALALDEQMKSGVAARTYQKEIGGAAMPWEVRAILEMDKLNAPGTTSEDFRDVAIDQNGQFTGDQLHTYRRNAQGGYDYFGPMTKRAEPVGGGGASNLPQHIVGNVENELVKEFQDVAAKAIMATYTEKEQSQAEKYQRAMSTLTDFKTGSIVPERVFNKLPASVRATWMQRKKEYVDEFIRSGNLSAVGLKSFGKPEREY